MNVPTWAPRKITLVIKTMTTNSTAPSHVLFDGGERDASHGFIKTLGNPEGPDALVCEFVGTGLARWLGLETSDAAIFEMPASPRIEYRNGFASLPGPAWASREIDGRVWDGSADDLGELANPEAISGLVLLDTWTRNLDRFGRRGSETLPRRNIRNVFVRWRDRRHRLVALDQSDCFGRFASDWVRRLRCIDEKKDETVYGLFPEFVPYVTRKSLRPFLSRLAAFRKPDMDQLLRDVPSAWIERVDTPDALTEFCVERAAFLCQRAETILAAACAWHPTLPFPEGGAT